MPEFDSARIAVILTALEVETRAVLRQLGAGGEEKVSGTVFRKGNFEGWDVAVAEVGAGNFRAAAIATLALHHYKPTVALFVGVAGGVKDVMIGNVVVGTKIYAYESGKDEASYFKARPDVMTVAFELEQRARALRLCDDWKKRLDPAIDHKASKILVGPIAAGEKVVASKRAATAKLIAKHYSDALAVEMEGRGFLEGVHISHPVQGCVVRGISDLLSGKANADKAGSQKCAADAASAVAFEILAGLGGHAIAASTAEKRAIGGPAAKSEATPPRVFISYSTKDGKAYADALRKELQGQGFSVWQDLIALEGGQDWWSQIENALKSKALQHFVLVVTPGALASSVVRREIRLARQEGKTVLPVKGSGLGDLGSAPRWIGQVYDLDLVEHRTTFKRVLEGPASRKRVPMMAPEPPADFVQRPVEFQALKRKLLDAKGDSVAITAALRGAGGYGKTTLASTLAHDPDIEDAYFDGILWAELGEKPENLLSIISDLIEILSGERPGLENLSAAAAKLGETLGDRRILLVIDDVWREQDLRPFLQGGRNTTRLITTRRDDILPPKTERQPVDAMAVDEALSLLSWDLPMDQVAAKTQALAALARRLGEWPQLLKLVNGFLLDRVLKNHEALPQAIAGVNRRLDIKGLTVFDAKNEAQRTNAVAKTIGVSLELLHEDERERFAELAVFPEDADVPLGIVSRLWRELDEFDAEDLLQRFQNLSLLLSLDLDRRTFRLHDTVRHYLQGQAGKDALAALHKSLLKALDGIDADAGADEPSRRYYFLHRAAHLAAGGERARLDALLLDPKWLQAKIDVVANTQALVADYEHFGQGKMQDLIGRTLLLTSGICERDKHQLMPQLHGRLLAQSGTAEFCSEALKVMVPPAILTYRPSLTPPGAEIARLEGHSHYVNALVILRDGRLASASADKTIRIWDVKEGAKTIVLEGHGGPVTALAVLSEVHLASGSEDKSIRIWNLRSGAEIALLEGHTAPVTALAVISDGSLASACGSALVRSLKDNTIRIWNVDLRTERTRLEDKSGSVNALAALRDGRLALASDDDTIRIWDPKSGEEITLEGHSARINALAVLADGRLASASGHEYGLAPEDHTIRIWDIDSRSETSRLFGHDGRVGALTVLPDGRLASGSDDKTIRVWDVDKGLSILIADQSNKVNALASLRDGRLAAAFNDTIIRLWDVMGEEKGSHMRAHRDEVQSLAVLPESRLASASLKDKIHLWDVKSGAQISQLRSDDSSVVALATLPDGRLASAWFDGTIRLWDIKTCEETSRLVGHRAPINALAVLLDGRLASASGELLSSHSQDNSVRLWDLETGVESRRIEGFSDRVSALTLLPNGCLAFASGNLSDRTSTIRLWDVEEWKEIARIRDVGHAVVALAALPDGRLAFGGSGSIIQLWDINRGLMTESLRGHNDWVMALAALPDGRLASASFDRTIRLWNPNSCEEITRLEVDAALGCLAALSDRRLVAGDRLGQLHWLEILN